MQVWACLRTLDSFGIQHAHVVSDPSTYSKKARLKTMCTAMGSQKWLTLHGHDSPEDAVAKLKADGYQVNRNWMCSLRFLLSICLRAHIPSAASHYSLAAKMDRYRVVFACILKKTILLLGISLILRRMRRRAAAASAVLSARTHDSVETTYISYLFCRVSPLAQHNRFRGASFDCCWDAHPLTLTLTQLCLF